MQLKKVRLKNFRCYREETEIEVGDLTALIGRNDVGKSTILDALDLFFEGGVVKFDSLDRNVKGKDDGIEITCVFTPVEGELVLDANSKTTLADEHLLNAEGDLEIVKVYSGQTDKAKKYFAAARHPTAEKAADLLQKKSAELKKIAKELDVEDNVEDKRSNVAFRKAIREGIGELDLKDVRVPLDKEDAKKVWERIQRELPIYALFKADRESTDGDSEVQDPMKAAIKAALGEVKDELEAIEKKIRERALDTANRTIEKLKSFDLPLAKTLNPSFREDPKWAQAFKLSLTGDEDIPINKRGSGVRRLVLFSFFRAEAERKLVEKDKKGIIYAVEEPETSQHPESQRLVIDALRELSEAEGTQVLVTTHVPALGELLPLESLRHLHRGEDGARQIGAGDSGTYEAISKDLGVLPDVREKRVKVLVCVEGPHDVHFLRNVSTSLREGDDTLPDFGGDARVAVVPLGGATLKDWVNEQYLRNLEIPEVHIYDRDTDVPPKYQGEVDAVNKRPDDSIAFLTTKREAENYLHKDAIKEVFGADVEVEVGDEDDVPGLVAEAVHAASESSTDWADLDEEKQRKKKGKAKRRLNREASVKMTEDLLDARNGKAEILGWLGEVKKRIDA